MRTMLIALLLIIGGCASAPSQTGNVCAVFDQKSGFINNWYRDAKRAERMYGVPVPILMATINTESSFKARARPPRKKLLGVIPWKRQSTAYGYSQALNGTWSEYQTKTGRFGARRADFGDAVQFVAWYHAQSNRRNGIALNDMYNLYLAYYSGHGGYSRGAWRNSSIAKNGASRAAGMAQKYANQMRACGMT
ncbi:transglycosylase SLT domain-containing protein [Pararhizobium haloflavum]|uniref:transglycosylase SLT domain-containing protein n=1 Tax=Pararhizobium haloflavum TaxID=2037914 RepID=UPI000C189426|nr:transglycosylase SLT domain-containing protein [Pararhizobium haloflavum]